MRYRLVRPMRREGTHNQQFAQRIPFDLKARMVGKTLAIPVGDEIVNLKVTDKTQSIRFSLRSGEPAEVKSRQAAAADYLEQVFQSLRTNIPVSLSHRNAVALSGVIYRGWAQDQDLSQDVALEHTEQGWVRVDHRDMTLVEEEFAAAIRHIDGLKQADDETELERAFGPLVDRLLLEHGIAELASASRSVILREFLKALKDGLAVQVRKAAGDYAPDSTADRFPAWDNEGERSASQVSIRALVDGWWLEAHARNLSPSTLEAYKKAINTFVEFLGHDNASRVSGADVVRFKDHLLLTISPRTQKTLSAKTVKDSYLSGLKSVFGWAVTNLKMQSNPATGITMKIAKKVKLREMWFSREEAETVLQIASNVPRGKKEPPQRHWLKRWVPWLCAYTGARLGEMVQLRKKDIRYDGERWILTITPDAVTVKNKQVREVPIHSHLVELGFPAFVEAAPDGPLFMWSGTGRSAWRNSKNRLTDFIRTIIADPNVRPNNAWRHTFKTIGSEVGIQDKVLDAICGHAPRTVGEAYGGVTLEAKERALGTFPRFNVTSERAQEDC